MVYAILIAYVLCGAYVQLRGQVCHPRLARRISDHANLFAPINCLFYAFSKIENTPYVADEHFPELAPLKTHWKTIREEALELYNEGQIKSSDIPDDLGFNSFFKTGWKRFYLTWYGEPLKSAQTRCPQTLALLNTIGAMFAMLPPGGSLVKHRDPYAGCYRYHLGLQTPNSESCFIEVDGQRYHWKDGEAVMFDETYMHYAENNTNVNRIVLFLDVKRPVTFFLADWINNLFSRFVMRASAAKNIEGDKVGGLNRLYPKVKKFRDFGKKVKSISVPVYYGAQIIVLAALLYWILF